MEQTTINQRLIFLLDKLKVSARTFSDLIGESPTNTQNYVGTRAAEPRAGYLENILRHFKFISSLWLITGEGEPLLPGTPESSIVQTGKFNQAGTRNKQTVTSNKVGFQANAGAVQGSHLYTALESANKEIVLLRQQLDMKDQLIAAKEEMLSLLRSQFNRPN